jgi:hypothetical protein
MGDKEIKKSKKWSTWQHVSKSAYANTTSLPLYQFTAKWHQLNFNENWYKSGEVFLAKCCKVLTFSHFYFVQYSHWCHLKNAFSVRGLLSRLVTVYLIDNLDKRSRVARWYIYIFRPKIVIWGNFVENVNIFYGHWVYFTAVWNILWPSGIFGGYLVDLFPVLVYCTKKNLSTLKRKVFSFLS